MAFLTLFFHFMLSPLAVPIWGGLSALVIHISTKYLEARKLQLESKKIDNEADREDRKGDREDFQVIKDSLYQELDRIKQTNDNTARLLRESEEENTKCEQRYYELAIQYRELLKYCANMARDSRILKTKVRAQENKNEQNNTNSETKGSPDE